MNWFASRLKFCLASAGVAFAMLAAGSLAHAQPKPASPLVPPVSVAADYNLGPGDVLHITVYQNADLSFDARITESGMVSFPLLGNLRLAGLTVDQAQNLIADGLRKGDFVKKPQVTIVITQVRGNQASVLGQVNRPGRFPLEAAETHLSDLLALAGGVIPTGAESVVVVGTRKGQPFRAQVNLPTLFAAPDRSGDLLVQNGDVVWVDRAPIVYIYGEVQRPGPMRLERNMTVLQALAAGGGLTQRGTERGIRVHHRDAAGKLEVTTPAMDDLLSDGDVVFVRESLF